MLDARCWILDAETKCQDFFTGFFTTSKLICCKSLIEHLKLYHSFTTFVLPDGEGPKQALEAAIAPIQKHRP